MLQLIIEASVNGIWINVSITNTSLKLWKNLLTLDRFRIGDKPVQVVADENTANAVLSHIVFTENTHSVGKILQVSRLSMTAVSGFSTNISLIFSKLTWRMN